MTEAPDEVIRVHEASHAVMCLALGVRVKWVDLYERDGHPFGEVMHEPAPADVLPKADLPAARAS